MLIFSVVTLRWSDWEGTIITRSVTSIGQFENATSIVVKIVRLTGKATIISSRCRVVNRDIGNRIL